VAILPMDRRDRLAELLTDDGVETLKHLAHEGMGENTLRAASVGPRLFGGLGGRRDRLAAAMAEDRGARVEIRGA
jgi:hypothetical protein